MKKLWVLLLVCALLLCGCGEGEETDRERDDDDTATTSVAAATEPLVEGTVTFEIVSGAADEYAVLTCTGEDGTVLWTYQTQESPWAMNTTLADIGRFENQYYFVAQGTVVALSMQDGAVLWTNEEFGGWPAADCRVIGEDGTVYLAGYYGPDFFAVDAQGNTLKLVDQIDPDYYWACRLVIADGQAAVYMRGGLEGDVGSENAVVLYTELP